MKLYVTVTKHSVPEPIERYQTVPIILYLNNLRRTARKISHACVLDRHLTRKSALVQYSLVRLKLGAGTVQFSTYYVRNSELVQYSLVRTTLETRSWYSTVWYARKSELV